MQAHLIPSEARLWPLAYGNSVPRWNPRCRIRQGNMIRRCKLSLEKESKAEQSQSLPANAVFLLAIDDLVGCKVNGDPGMKSMARLPDFYSGGLSRRRRKEHNKTYSI
jgi:hypothetical protein